jgi:hypothetical protein
VEQKNPDLKIKRSHNPFSTPLPTEQQQTTRFDFEAAKIINPKKPKTLRLRHNIPQL